MSTKGIALLQEFEGFVARKYLCAAGAPTIGYGHVIGAGEPALNTAVLTKEQAVELLKRDLVRYESAVTAHVKVPLTQHQFDALVSFTYNCGAAALAKSSLLKLVNSKAEAGLIRTAFSLWNKGGGRVLEALVKRRAKEAALFLTA